MKDSSLCIPWPGVFLGRRQGEKMSGLLTALNRGFLKLGLGHLLSQQSEGLVKIHMSAAHQTRGSACLGVQPRESAFWKRSPGDSSACKPEFEICFLNYNYLFDVPFLKCPRTESSGILKSTFVPYSSHPVLLIVPEYVFTQSAFYEVHKDILTQQITSPPKVSVPSICMKGT